MYPNDVGYWHKGDRTRNTDSKEFFRAFLKWKVGFTERVSLALRILLFTIHTGLKVASSELHHGEKPRTNLTNMVKDKESCWSDCTKYNISGMATETDSHLCGP